MRLGAAPAGQTTARGGTKGTMAAVCRRFDLSLTSARAFARNHAANDDLFRASLRKQAPS